MDMEDRDYLPPFSDHILKEARLVTCGYANDVEEAKDFLGALGLLNNDDRPVTAVNDI